MEPFPPLHNYVIECSAVLFEGMVVLAAFTVALVFCPRGYPFLFNALYVICSPSTGTMQSRIVACEEVVRLVALPAIVNSIHEGASAPVLFTAGHAESAPAFRDLRV